MLKALPIKTKKKFENSDNVMKGLKAFFTFFFFFFFFDILFFSFCWELSALHSFDVIFISVLSNLAFT